MTAFPWPDILLPIIIPKNQWITPPHNSTYPWHDSCNVYCLALQLKSNPIPPHLNALPRKEAGISAPHQREEHIRIADPIVVATRQPLTSRFTVFFCLVLLFTGNQGASAGTAEPSAIRSSTTDSGPVSSETSTLQVPSSPAAPQEPKTLQAPQPAAKTKTENRLGPQVDPCYTVSIDGETWMDQVHDYVQDNTCEPAVWFDVFFVKDHVLLDLRPGAFITLRNSVRWTEGGTVAYVHDFHLEWRLPQWENYLKKWKLYVQSRF